MPRKITALALAALTSFAIGACGGDDDTTSSDSTSSEDFVAEVTAACDEAGTQLAESQLTLQGAVLDGEGDLASVVQEELVPVYDNMLSDLEGITPPSDQADTYEQLLSNLNESVDLLKNNAEEIFAAAGGEQNEITKQVDELEAESDQLASELGIPENCGEGEVSGATGAEGTG